MLHQLLGESGLPRVKRWYAKLASVSLQPQLKGPSDDIELAAAIMDRHIATLARIFAIGEKLVHEVGELEATLLEDPSLSVLTEYDIFRD